ncbi:MAG: hypothetical protein M1434_12105 [Chloroflexi bacterium]|nr:hypothetical protein [Chloroflexota bacterium]MCL5275466.1 hypothetical protein [Chloroflexota bacterium]
MADLLFIHHIVIAVQRGDQKATTPEVMYFKLACAPEPSSEATTISTVGLTCDALVKTRRRLSGDHGVTARAY